MIRTLEPNPEGAQAMVLDFTSRTERGRSPQNRAEKFLVAAACPLSPYLPTLASLSVTGNAVGCQLSWPGKPATEVAKGFGTKRTAATEKNKSPAMD